MPVKEHFAKSVGDYDTVVDAVVMKNDRLHAYLAASLELSFEKPLEILDIGIGTGHGAGLILKKYPLAFVTGVDFSGRMLAKAEKNLAEYAERIRLIESNILDFVPGKRFDGIISAVTMHNLSSDEKSEVFGRLAEWLRPGGIFVNGDFCKREDEESDRRSKEIYLEHVRSHLSGEELTTWLHHIEHDDKPEKLSEQFVLLELKGFEKPQLTWQYENEAVYRAERR